MYWYMFTSNIKFTFILQCSLLVESEDIIITVWIDLSHFQDRFSGYRERVAGSGCFTFLGGAFSPFYSLAFDKFI